MRWLGEHHVSYGWQQYRELDERVLAHARLLMAGEVRRREMQAAGIGADGFTAEERAAVQQARAANA